MRQLDWFQATLFVVMLAASLAIAALAVIGILIGMLLSIAPILLAVSITLLTAHVILRRCGREGFAGARISTRAFQRREN